MVKKEKDNDDLKTDIKYHIDEIARHRTELRNLIEYVTEIIQNCDDGIELLEAGVDKLSEHL